MRPRWLWYWTPCRNNLLPKGCECRKWKDFMVHILVWSRMSKFRFSLGIQFPKCDTMILQRLDIEIDMDLKSICSDISQDYHGTSKTKMTECDTEFLTSTGNWICFQGRASMPFTPSMPKKWPDSVCGSIGIGYANVKLNVNVNRK